MRVDGTLRVDGTCDGILEVGEMLVIGKTGEFTGEIRAREVVVVGRVRGTITATETVELQKGCHFEGDVRTRTFVVEAGVFFQGNCRMEDAEARGVEGHGPAALGRVGTGAATLGGKDSRGGLLGATVPVKSAKADDEPAGVTSGVAPAGSRAS